MLIILGNMVALFQIPKGATKEKGPRNMVMDTFRGPLALLGQFRFCENVPHKVLILQEMDKWPPWTAKKT